MTIDSVKQGIAGIGELLNITTVGELYALIDGGQFSAAWEVLEQEASTHEAAMNQGRADLLREVGETAWQLEMERRSHLVATDQATDIHAAATIPTGQGLRDGTSTGLGTWTDRSWSR